MMRRGMSESRVPLPRGVTLAVHRLPQRRAPGARARLPGPRRARWSSPRELVKEGKLGFWKWFWGAWGIGTYGKNDQVDVAWEVDGRPRVAHALDIERESELLRRSTAGRPSMLAALCSRW